MRALTKNARDVVKPDFFNPCLAPRLHITSNNIRFPVTVVRKLFFNLNMKIPSLVSVQWLAQAILKTKPSRPLRIVEATWRLQGGSSEASKEHLESRIPGTVFFNIDECCDESSELPHMLPNEKIFAEYVRHLGITNESHVVAYDNNEDFGLFSSPRLWWTFRCFGHNAISVLNGGLSKWLDAGLPVETGEEKPAKSKT